MSPLKKEAGGLILFPYTERLVKLVEWKHVRILPKALGIDTVKKNVEKQVDCSTFGQIH